MRALAALILAPVLFAGCASTPGDEERPFVIGNAHQIGSLFWRGELTDHRGNLWNVKLIPGVAPSVEAGVDAWKDGLDFASDPGEAKFWKNRGEDVKDGLDFAGDTVLHDFFAEGLSEDLHGAGEAISSNVRETPFAWIPRILGNAAWGIVIKPVARIAATPVGIAGGLTYSIAAPILHVVARPAGGLGYGVVAGTAIPAARLALHPPTFLLALVNREPAVRHDGTFGLRIISGPDVDEPPPLEQPADGAAPAEAPAAPARPFAQVMGEAVAQQQSAVLDRIDAAEREQLEQRLAARRAQNGIGIQVDSDDPAVWRQAWESWTAKADPDHLAGDAADFQEVLHATGQR